MNVPQRAMFIEEYGDILLLTGVVLYAAGLWVAFSQNIGTLAAVLAPGVAGTVYSLLRLKKVLLGKNIIVGLSWGAIPLLVGAYFSSHFSTAVLVLFGFFSVGFFINTVIFDIKDIEGDTNEGVKTLPNTYGVEGTKTILHLVNVFLAAVTVILGILGVVPPSFLILLLFNSYVTIYILYAKQEQGPVFYGLFVDGECIFLAVAVILAYLVGGVDSI